MVVARTLVTAKLGVVAKSRRAVVQCEGWKGERRGYISVDGQGSLSERETAGFGSDRVKHLMPSFQATNGYTCQLMVPFHP